MAVDVGDRWYQGALEPRICVYPEAPRTAGRAAVDLARHAGLYLDPWQALLLERAMGVREDGKWAAREVAIMVARQNGKSALIEARILAGLFIIKERLILYSAHEFKSAIEIFRRVLSLIEGTPSLRSRVKAVHRSKGEEGVELVTGQRLRFVARSTNSGRGFSADCAIWDESQNLPDAAVDAMLPTMLARPNPQLWYAGSAPDKDLAPCDQVARVRRRALDGSDKALAYFEWSADLCSDLCPPGCTAHDDPDSPETWAKCNPALGSGRVTIEGLASLHASMSPRGFAREVLSVGNYPVEGGGWDVISQAAWEATADEDSRPEDPVAFALDVTPDRSMAAIAVFGGRADGLEHGEIVDHRPGTGWVVERVRNLRDRWRPCAVALDASGPAGSLIPDLEAAGVQVTIPRARDVAAACGGLYDAVVRPPDAGDDWSASFRHIPHPALTAALAGAARRPLGDAWAWDRRGVEVDISPLVALTLARWAYVSRDPGPVVVDIAQSVW